MADKTVTVRLEALVSQYQAAMATAAGTTRQFGTSLSEQTAKAQIMQQGFTTLGLGAVALGTAMLGGFVMATKAAIDFESSFAGVRKTVEATESEFGVLADGLREMATEIPVNVNELNRIAESAGQLGVAKGAILEFTRTVADMSVATNLSSEDAANAFARLGNIMQTPQDQFDRMGSAIVHLGNVLPATEAEIVEFGLRIAPAGHLAGLAESDVLALSAALASVGNDAEAGGTAVQKVLLSMISAVNQGGEQLDTFAQTAGMSAQDFAGAWQADPAQAFVAFVEGLGASGQDAQNILAELGLTDQRLIKTFLSLANAGDLLRDSIEQGSDASRENTALTKEAEERYGTTASQIQIAMNKINDAAISFGETFLPVIAAVVGPIGAFVGLIGELPGPLRAAAMAGLLLGGAMLVIAGATLLFLPRLEAVKASFAAAGRSTNIFRGSLQTIAGAVNPVTIGLTAAAIVLGRFAQEQAESRARVDELTEALKAHSGALSEDTRNIAIHTLQTNGAFETAKAFGIGLDLVTDASLGNADAQAQVGAALDDVSAKWEHLPIDGTDISDATVAADTLRSKIGAFGAELATSQTNYQDFIAADGEAADSMGETGDAVTRYGEALGGVRDEMVGTTEAGQLLSETLDLLAGGAIGAEEAALAWHDGLRTLRQELRKGEKTLRGYGEEATNNKQAILDQIETGKQHAIAVAEETGSVKKGAAAFADHTREIIRTAEALGFSKKEVRDYIEQLELTPKNIRTMIQASTQNALGDVRAYEQAVRNVPTFWETRFAATGATPRLGPRHHGGEIGGSLGPRRLHGGGPIMPNMRDDEELFIGQHGERVLTKAENRTWEALNAPMTAMPARSSGGSGGDNASLVGLRITGKVDTPFGPSQMRAVVVEVIDAETDFHRRVARMHG